MGFTLTPPEMPKNKLKLIKAKVQVNFNEILRGVKKGQEKENKDFWNTTNPLRKLFPRKYTPKSPKIFPEHPIT